MSKPEADLMPWHAHRKGMEHLEPSLTFYLAARYSRRLELCTYKSELQQRGHAAPARWLLGEHQAHGVEAARAVEDSGPVPAEQARLFASDDVEDVLAADVIIGFTEEPRSSATRGGRHVEFGIGLGLRRGGPAVHAPTLVIVGPLENVFHALPEVDAAFDSWEDFLVAFDALPLLHGIGEHELELCHEHPLHKQANEHRAQRVPPFRRRKAADR